MNANDFFLLFVAFGSFLVVPGILLWGIAWIARGKSGSAQRPSNRSDAGSPDGSSNGAASEKGRGVRAIGAADEQLH